MAAMETAPLLRLDGLSITRPDGSTVLAGIDLTVPADGVLGILGESGAGKTTLAKAMAGWVSAPLRVSSGCGRGRG